MTRPAPAPLHDFLRKEVGALAVLSALLAVALGMAFGSPGRLSYRHPSASLDAAAMSPRSCVHISSWPLGEPAAQSAWGRPPAPSPRASHSVTGSCRPRNACRCSPPMLRGYPGTWSSAHAIPERLPHRSLERP
jgi:hypothetical protein